MQSVSLGAGVTAYDIAKVAALVDDLDDSGADVVAKKKPVAGISLTPGTVVEFGGGLSVVLEVSRSGVLLESAGGHLRWVEFGPAKRSRGYRGCLKGVVQGAVQHQFVLGNWAAFERAENWSPGKPREDVVGGDISAADALTEYGKALDELEAGKSGGEMFFVDSLGDASGSVGCRVAHFNCRCVLVGIDVAGRSLS